VWRAKMGVRTYPIDFKRSNRKPKAGYVGYSKLSRITIPVFNRVVSFCLITLGLPFFLIISIIIKLKDPGPIFYRGTRLGLNKVPFEMYKFRTLPVGAQSILGARLVTPKDFRLSWFSKFLRDTRLDELPQLFNVLKGDMDLIGPRPLRPEIYEKYCKHIPNYELRFLVRPGLIGYSQLCTPHSAPKRIRALIDNTSIRLKRSLAWDILIIIVTGLAVLRKIILLLVDGFWKHVVNERILRKYKDRRVYDRIKQGKSYVRIYHPTGAILSVLPIEDINEEYFRVKTNGSLDMNVLKDQLNAEIVRVIRKRRRYRRKVAGVKIVLEKYYSGGSNGSTVTHYIFGYIPNGQYNRYIIDQYFLLKSVLNYF